MDIDEFKKIAEIGEHLGTFLQSLVTSGALIVGGLWTYNKFIKNRNLLPKINTSHKVTCIQLNQNKILLHIEIIIVNDSDVIVKLKDYMVSVYQILPLKREVEEFINLDSSKINYKHNFLQNKWGVIAHNEEKPNSYIVIEPKEKERIYCEFILDSQVETIKVYSYIKNILLKREKGWSLFTLHNINKLLKDSN